MRTPSLVGLLLVLGAVGGLFVDNAHGVAEPPTGAREPGDIVVASFNIRHGAADDGEDRWSKRASRCIEAICRLDADIIGLQEALHPQLVQIAAALPEHTVVGVGRDDGKDGGEHCAIVIRDAAFETFDHATFWLSDAPERPGSRSFGNDIPRICTWVQVKHRTSGLMIRVVNLHLDHRSATSRERSVELVRTRLGNVPAGEAVILLGDLNAAPESAPFRALLAPVARRSVPESGPVPGPATAEPIQLHDTWRLANADAPEPPGTFHAFRGESSGPRIDVVFASAEFAVRGAAIDRRPVGERWPSDHFPVVARLRPSAALHSESP